MKWKHVLLGLPLLAVLQAHPVSAEPVVLASGVIGAYYEVQGRTIDVYLPGVSGSGPLILQLSGFNANRDYVVNAHLINDSGQSWRSLEAEVLNPADGRDDRMDVSPQPSYAPTGYSSSNRLDGFSFAQGSSLERGSDTFADVFADERTHARDLLRYSGGVVASGGSTLLTFGLRDYEGNRPWLLALGPNGLSAAPTPEPTTLLLLGTGVVGVARVARQRRRRTS
jgi:hypothetical protein